MSSRRSASVGASPRENKHFVSRNVSASGATLDVRCGCQFFQCDSLLDRPDSRPTSRIGYHEDAVSAYTSEAGQKEFASRELLSHGEEPLHLHAAALAPLPEEPASRKAAERRRSMGGTSVHRSREWTPALEHYPEMAKRAGPLVVCNIADAINTDSAANRKAFLAGRQMSESRIPNVSGPRDVETMSMHSERSFHRRPRSMSRSELYVSNINIPSSRGRSVVSTSRRASNAELTRFSEERLALTTMNQQQLIPQLNLIAPTPTPLTHNKPPDFASAMSSRQTSVERQDYRVAKPPITPDYMRPDDNKEHTLYNATRGMLPQNRPIDVSMYGYARSDSTTAEEAPGVRVSTIARPMQMQRTLATDPLQQEVSEIEQIMLTHNVEDISDNIRMQTTPPPYVDQVENMSLKLGERTQINITSAIPEPSIDMDFSPPMSPTQQTFIAENQQLRMTPPPDMNVANSNQPSILSLKRESAKDEPAVAKQMKLSFAELPKTTLESTEMEKEIKNSEPKTGYASKFKSLFSSNNNSQNTDKKSESLPIPVKEEKLEIKQIKEKSPARSFSKIMPKFTKAEPTALTIVTGGSAVMTKPPEKEYMAVKVTETFSLKVDDMDQYSTRPPVAPTSSASPLKIKPSQTPYKSRESMREESQSVDMTDAFAPVVLTPGHKTPIISGKKTLYSSQIDIPVRRSESELFDSTEIESTAQDSGTRLVASSGSAIISGSGIVGGSHIPKGGLISVPIRLGSSENEIKLRLGRDVSEQRFSQKPFQYNAPAERTQSQDRFRLKTALETEAFTPIVTKTVNIQDRPSRLSNFEKNTVIEKPSLREHEYEPIGVPPDEKLSTTITSTPISSQPQPITQQTNNNILNDFVINEKVHTSIEIIPPTSDEGQSDQADSISLDEPPLKDSRKHSFMASAQDRTRKLRTGFKNQAGKIKSKLRSPAKHTPPPSDVAEKPKEQKRFKAPDFPHFKFSGIKRPNVSKLKDIKYPEFAKFNKPDMSKFKLPEKFTTMKLRRSKSFKENEPEPEPDNIAATAEPHAPKKLFEFNFGTYPRAFRKKNKPIEPQSSFGTETGTEVPSTMPSTGTQASVESSSSPQGDRGPGPVRSSWAHKLTDIAYNESEGSRYRSDQESFDRESSVERRMKDTLERNNSEAAESEILGGVTESKQFAEFDEENRAIHEISNLRAGEFRRRPLPHQDSDLRSEDSKDAVGWTDSEIQKNRLLRQAEMEAEASYLKYPSIEAMTQETQSTASSGKKVVMEEIDDDEFFLRKRGISEDNIELRQYISEAIREGYDEPVNALKHVGRTNEPLEYRDDYRVPPPKPRRLQKGFRNQNMSQETGSMHSDFGDDLSMSQNGSDFISSMPKAPMRKARSRSKYSMDSQDVAIENENDRISQQLHYFDDDEDYLRPPNARVLADDTTNLNDLNISNKHEYDDTQEDMPQAPSRKKRQQRESSLDKNSYIEEFMGRSISNSFLQAPGEQVIVYRTEHEYHHIPLATPENASTPSKKSRTPSYFDEELHTIEVAQFDDVDGNLKDNDDLNDKFIIDMMESDGYAVVRKEYMPKPTPPARRKKFTRSPGERFVTMPGPTPHSAEPPARPPPPESYTPSLDGTQASPIAPRSMSSLDAPRNYEDDFGESDDYDRAGSPRNLQSGEVINKMKFRPLPPPPRPPREKRQRSDKKSGTPSRDSVISEDTSEARLPIEEIEVSTQTDPLPDDFECEEFEITDDMKVIEPRYQFKTLDELLQKEQDAELDRIRQMTESEQLQQSVQRFRDANQRSVSEKSRSSSQADRSRSLSRPQTPSALVIERRVSTPVPNRNSETMLEASLTVQPIDDLDLEEEALRREGLLSDSSHHSKSDLASNPDDEEPLKRVSMTKEFKQPEETALSEKESEITESTAETEEEDTLVPYLRKYHESLLADNSELTPFDLDHIKNEYLHGEKYLLSDIEELSTNVDSDQQEDREKLSDLDQATTGVQAHVQPENIELSDIELQSLSIEEEIKALRLAYESKLAPTRPKEFAEKTEEQIVESEPPQPPPLPPPRRKSAPQIEAPTTLADVSPTTTAQQEPTTITTEPTTSIAISEPLTSAVHTEQALTHTEQAIAPTLDHLEQLEVERASVGALQAGQIMVSQMHGGQISAENFDCKSSNIIVQNIELPTGFIEDIVQRVRRTEHGPAITTETQTSLQASAETLLDEAAPRTTQTSQPQSSHQTHIESRPIAPIEVIEMVTSSMQTTPIQSLPPSYPQHFVEQVQTQPRPVYAETSHGAMDCDTEQRQRMRRSRRRRHRDYSSSEYDDNDDDYVEQDEEPQPLRHRSRSRTQPREVQPSVMQAGRQFISACALSLVRIINHLTDYVRGNGEKDQERPAIPTLVVLFIGITIALIIYLLSRQSVHTHHWDFFNPPGNNGRPT